IPDVILSEAVCEERCYAVADLHRADIQRHGVDRSPRFMTQPARSGRKGHPFRPLPWCDVGCAYAASFDADPDLTRLGPRYGDLLDGHGPWAGQDGSLRRAGGFPGQAVSTRPIRLQYWQTLSPAAALPASDDIILCG